MSGIWTVNKGTEPHQHIQIKDTLLVGRALLNFTSIFVSLGVFIFGFEQGLMSSLLTNQYFKDYYKDPSPAAIGTMIAILEIGALFSSFVAGKAGDIWGRRKTIRYGSFIFVVGGIIQCTSVNIFNLGCGRLVSGVAIGFLTTIIPCYQSEISPPEDRGFYACLEFTGNIIGYSSSIWVDYGFSFIENDYSWRSPLFVQCVIGTMLFLGTFLIVETPRWLLDHNHDLEGMIVIADLYGNGDVEDYFARQEYRNIKESILIARVEGGERSYTYLFHKYAKRVSVACFSQMFAQMNGINIIAYYAPMIFELAGWMGRLAILMTGLNSLIYVLSTIPPWYLVDSWGRKPLLLSGAILMGVPLLLIAYSLKLNNEYTPNVVVACVVVTNAAFGYSWGPIPWLMSEIFPNSVRSKGAALSTATNWLFNFIVGEMTPILLASIKWKTYLFPAASCFLSFLAVEFLFPETKGLTLEDMGSVFDDSSSIFSFHSGRGSTNASSSSSVRKLSAVRSAASVARDPTTMSSSDVSLLASPAPPVASQSQRTPLLGSFPGGPGVAGLRSDNDIPSMDDVPPQEIEPPSFDEIYQHKVKKYMEPTLWNKLFSHVKPIDQETPLLHNH